MPRLILDDLYAESSLCDYIRDHRWSRMFDRKTLNRGDRYAADDAILSAKAESTPAFITLTAKVRGSYEKSYTTTIRLTAIRNEWKGYTQCSCPVYADCKHAAALLFTIADTLEYPPPAEASAPDDIQKWLGKLVKTNELIHKREQENKKQTAKKKALRRTHGLAFLIDPQPGGIVHMTLGKIAYSRDGTISVDNDSLSPNIKRKKPAYFTDSDYELAFAIQHQLPDSPIGDYWTKHKQLDANYAAEFLQPLLETGRLFLKSSFKRFSTPTPLSEGPTIGLQPSWESLPGDLYRPTLGLPSEEHTLLPLDITYYINAISHSLGRTEVAKNVPAELLSIWSDGPAVPATEAAELCVNMESMGIPMSLPRPITLEERFLKKVIPTPVLTLSRNQSILYLQQDTFGGHVQSTPPPLVTAQLSFNYDGNTVNIPIPDGEKPATRITKKDHILVISRDTMIESAALRLLLDVSLALIGFDYDEEQTAPGHEFDLIPALPVEEWDLFWINFITHDISELETAGWKVIIDPSVQLDVIESDDIFTELNEDPERGIDWFQFDTGIVTTEGQRLSLLELIATFLKSGAPIPENDEIVEEQRVVLPDQQGKAFFNLPAQRFFRIVRSVRDLFNRPDDGLHRLEAAKMADTLKLDESKTLADLRALGQQLRKQEPHKPVKLPKLIKADLRDYQKNGFQWLQFLARHHLHGILADDMGLGKTLQTLTHIAAEIENGHSDESPTLVVAPTSVVPNWAAEATKFAPKLKVLVLHGTDRKKHFKKIDEHDLVITSYALLQRDEAEHARHSYHLAILDEAQYIKNPKAKVATAACKLDARHRICLSGTPMENHLGELWSLSRFLMPGLLGAQTDFNAHFKNPIERHADSHAQAALNNRVAPLILRRTKDQVVTELPPKTELIHSITLNKAQQDLYESVRTAMDKRVRNAIEERGLARSQIIVLDALLKLRQICCHPQLIKTEIAKQAKDSAKLDFLVELLATLIEEGRRILLFSQFTTMLGMIEKHLKKEKIPFVKITGATRDRKTPVEKFQKGETPVFLISLKAGGTGLNLTAADTVIHYDPWWNPAAENQATDRAHRIGQKNPVFVHKLISEGTIEERILELQSKKSKLVEALLSSKTTKLNLDTETLGALLAPLDQ